jgi:hypothetical protein
MLREPFIRKPVPSDCPLQGVLDLGKNLASSRLASRLLWHGTIVAWYAVGRSGEDLIDLLAIERSDVA